MPFITKTKTTKAKSLLLEQAQRDLAEQFRKCILVTYIMLLKCSQGLSSYFMSRRAQGLNGQLSLALSGHFWLLVMSIIVIKTLIISCYVYDPTFTGYWVTLSHRYLEYRNNDPAISVAWGRRILHGLGCESPGHVISFVSHLVWLNTNHISLANVTWDMQDNIHQCHDPFC